MTRWRDPDWSPDRLTPDHLYARGGFVASVAEVAGRGAAAAAGWRDPLPRVAGSGDDSWVLVGGAGFLGARIAVALLEAGAGPVTIVARRPERIGGEWAAMAGPAAAERWLRDPRLRLVAADIASADLGWTRSVPRAGVVLHLAAAVHALAGWDRLAGVNLHGLRASVALARRDDALLQLASTLSVFVASNAARADVAMPLAPSLASGDDVWLHGGYAQTKAAAEYALVVAGLSRWQVVRFGLLVPEAGRPFPADHFAPAFCDALRRVEGVPDLAERAAVDLTPVDRAAAVAIACARAGGPQVAHCANPISATLEEVVAALGHVHGDLPVIAVAAWRARVAALPAIPRALLRAAFGKTRFLHGDAARGPLLNVDLFQSTHRRYGSIAAMPGPAALLPGLVASMAGTREQPR